MAAIRSIKATEYETLVRQSSGTVLLDIWGSGCAPCVVVGNILVDLSEELEGLTVYKMNFADGPDIAVELGVTGLPSLYLFREGKVAKQHTGAITKKDLHSWILD